jgi:hypothetical protein
MSNRSLWTNQEEGDDCMIASVSSPSKTATVLIHDTTTTTTTTTNENRTMAVENGQPRQRALVAVHNDDEEVADDFPLQQQQQQLVDVRDNHHETANDTTHAEEATTTNTTTAEDDDSQLQQQQQRQEEEDLAQSIELARMLMAEEAMASYQQSFQLLRDSADQLSPEDYNALQAAMMEDERDEAADFLHQHHHDRDGNQEDGDDDNDEEEEEGDEEQHLSYETLLQLGERIGDVKTERWTMEARMHIARLPTETFHAKKELEQQQQADGDAELKCLVCQSEYEDNDTLRRLPCGHCFHADCVDQWLTRTDQCPYCRTSIIMVPSTTNNND